MPSADLAGLGADTILVAEDDLTARAILSEVLPRRFPGMKIILAENGQEGLNLFLQHNPKLVVTDVAMPVMDGFAMARAIRSIRPETVIISISAHTSKEYRTRAVEAGISFQVEKPLNLKSLFLIIEKVLLPMPQEERGGEPQFLQK